MAVCGICQETFPKLHTWECGQSSFCTSCSKQWIQNSLSSNQLPQCISGCQTHVVSISFIKKLVSHTHIIKKAEILYAENSIPHKDRMYCHNCSFPFPKNKSVLNCTKCQATTCVKCSMPWKRKHTCKETDLETKDSINKAGFQQCICGCIIERSDFCNKIKCRCGRTFCYKCNEDYDKGVKKCDCAIYDDNIMFIMYAERLFQIITEPILSTEKYSILDTIINRCITNFVNLVSSYKTKMSDERERQNVVKLQHPIFGGLIQLASFELGFLPFSPPNQVKTFKDIESIVLQARAQRSETALMKQQLLNTYSELIETKRKLSELEKKRKL